MTVDATERELLAETLRRAMSAHRGAALDAALREAGWPDMLAELPDVAVPLAFRLLGETGSHAPLVNDVIAHAAGLPAGWVVPLPYAGGGRVRWERGAPEPGWECLDAELPLRRVAFDSSPADLPGPLAAGRRAIGWWLTGTSRAMLRLAREHAVDRVQFGRPIASFQAVRHRLAETLVAIEGADAALTAAASGDELSGLLAKAAAGRAALAAARHCQQVLGGIGFTAEHDLHRHIRRALVLDGLLGSTRELVDEAGRLVLRQRSAPRLVEL